MLSPQNVNQSRAIVCLCVYSTVFIMKTKYHNECFKCMIIITIKILTAYEKFRWNQSKYEPDGFYECATHVYTHVHTYTHAHTHQMCWKVLQIKQREGKGGEGGAEQRRSKLCVENDLYHLNCLIVQPSSVYLFLSILLIETFSTIH